MRRCVGGDAYGYPVNGNLSIITSTKACRNDLNNQNGIVEIRRRLLAHLVFDILLFNLCELRVKQLGHEFGIECLLIHDASGLREDSASFQGAFELSCIGFAVLLHVYLI